MNVDGVSAPAWVVWLSCGSCEGCTMSVLGASAPRLEDLLAGHLTVAPRIELVHSALALDGHDYLATLERAANGELQPFLLVVEGAIFDEPPTGHGYYSGLGERDGQPITLREWVARLAPAAAAVLAIGACATTGGVPAAAGSATGASGLESVLGRDFRTERQLPVINVPGCPPSGDAFVEVLSYTLLHLDNIVPLDLDDLGRPRWVYNESTPLRQVRQGAHEPAVSERADCPVPRRGWINRLGGCAVIGGSCIGCTRPDFPDATLAVGR